MIENESKRNNKKAKINKRSLVEDPNRQSLINDSHQLNEELVYKSVEIVLTRVGDYIYIYIYKIKGEVEKNSN